jgi:hypothetical protein
MIHDATNGLVMVSLAMRGATEDAGATGADLPSSAYTGGEVRVQGRARHTRPLIGRAVG